MTSDWGRVGLSLRPASLRIPILSIRPQQGGDSIVSFVTVCGLDGVARLSWLELGYSDSHTEHMTPRENLIARALAEGKTNKEIARQQDLSPGTVKNYTSNLFSKLGVRNRAEAIVRLKELGLF